MVKRLCGIFQLTLLELVGVIPLPLSMKGLALAPGLDPAKYSIQANESITNDSDSF